MKTDKTKTQADPGRALREAARQNSSGSDALAQALIQRATQEGLLDVAYAETDSPVGKLLLATTPRGLVKVSFPTQPFEEVLERLAREISPRVLEAPAQLDAARRELDRYFEGRLQEFDLPLDWRLSHGFYRKVLRATARIPYGQTRSYSEMAKRAGSPRAVRATGSALGSNPIPIVVPCHRVLRTGGALGGYGGGIEMKQTLLELEGAIPAAPGRGSERAR
jgi:methylated-DNA-[protein]-cysteine S-methyltransferase